MKRKFEATKFYSRVLVGMGWYYYPEEDNYAINNREFVITGGVVRERMRDWGRKIEAVHIIAVLNNIYREHFGK